MIHQQILQFKKISNSLGDAAKNHRKELRVALQAFVVCGSLLLSLYFYFILPLFATSDLWVTLSIAASVGFNAGLDVLVAVIMNK